MALRSVGSATASLEPLPRRWVQRFWGFPSIDYRQKWSLFWPAIRSLPPEGVRLLDAGCGSGAWSLELATRRKGWLIIGLDRDEHWLEQASVARDRLMLQNLELVKADFLEYQPPRPVDVVLSIASAHYLAEGGRGPELFSRFRGWLRPGGLLLLFAPRKKDEVPVIGRHPPYPLRDVFSRSALEQLCAESRFEILCLDPCIGRLGTAAKHLSRVVGFSPVLRAAAYPVEFALWSLDTHFGNPAARSYAWRLVARAA